MANAWGFSSSSNVNNYVTADGTQTIDGAKTFTNELNSFTGASFIGGTFTGDGSNLTNIPIPSNYPTNTAPVGTIVLFSSNTLPNGWLLCDGSLVSVLTYSSLFAIIGYTYTVSPNVPTAGNFYLPDFRGMVARGKGLNPNIDPYYTSNTTLGTIQPQSAGGHTHDIIYVETNTQETTGSATVLDNVTGVPGLVKSHQIVSNSVVTTRSIAGIANMDFMTRDADSAYNPLENRVNNLSINYIIKFGGVDTYTSGTVTSPSFIQAGPILNINNVFPVSGSTALTVKNAAGATFSAITTSSTVTTIGTNTTIGGNITSGSINCGNITSSGDITVGNAGNYFGRMDGVDYSVIGNFVADSLNINYPIGFTFYAAPANLTFNNSTFAQSTYYTLGLSSIFPSGYSRFTKGVWLCNANLIADRKSGASGGLWNASSYLKAYFNNASGGTLVGGERERVAFIGNNTNEETITLDFSSIFICTGTITINNYIQLAYNCLWGSGSVNDGFLSIRLAFTKIA